MNSRYEGKQSNRTRNMKHVNFVPKDVQRILSSRKSILNRKSCTRKLFLKILQYSQEDTCVGISYSIKIQAFRAPVLLKRDSNTGVFYEHWEIFKNTYFEEHLRRLLLRFSLELFPIWANNIGIEEDVFSKTKQNKNRSETQLYENKTCLFMMFFIILFFSFSPLQVRRHLPYILNKQFWNNLTNEQLILNQWKNYSLISSILYLLRGSLS